MGTHYKLLTLIERYQIQTYHDQRLSAREIARRLGRSHKTVSLELKRRGADDYCALRAQGEAHHKRPLISTKFHKCNKRVINAIDCFLFWRFTPEQMAERMQLEGGSFAVSMQTIYRLIVTKGWRHRLPRKGKRYRTRSAQSAGVSLIPGRVNLEVDTHNIMNKEYASHW